MLVLPIKKQWFDLIVSGEKREEYRAFNAYYRKRFHADEEEPVKNCILRNGYSSASPEIGIDFTLDVGHGRAEWGAVPEETYFILRIEKTWPTARVQDAGREP